jgi:hypothetical protein
MVGLVNAKGLDGGTGENRDERESEGPDGVLSQILQCWNHAEREVRKDGASRVS